MNRKLIAASACVVLWLGATACSEPGPAEKAGKAMDDAAQDAGKAMNEAAKDASDAMEEAADKAREAYEDSGK